MGRAKIARSARRRAPQPRASRGARYRPARRNGPREPDVKTTVLRRLMSALARRDILRRHANPVANEAKLTSGSSMIGGQGREWPAADLRQRQLFGRLFGVKRTPCAHACYFRV